MAIILWICAAFAGIFAILVIAYEIREEILWQREKREMVQAAAAMERALEKMVQELSSMEEDEARLENKARELERRLKLLEGEDHLMEGETLLRVVEYKE